MSPVTMPSSECLILVKAQRHVFANRFILVSTAQEHHNWKIGFLKTTIFHEFDIIV